MLALVAVNDGEIRDMVSQALRLGYPNSVVTHTNSGQECVDQARMPCPDIVILDSYLKDLSGFEAIRQIRNFSDVPIIMLSYFKEESQVVKALELGADEYIVKPVHSMEMLARIKALLKRNQSHKEMCL